MSALSLHIESLTISWNGTDCNGLKPLTISQNGTDGTVYRRATQCNAFTKYQVSNAFGRSPRLSNSSTFLLKKELPSSLSPVKPKVGKFSLASQALVWPVRRSKVL